MLKRERVLKYREKDESPPFKITWVATYSPATPKIEKVVNKANEALKMSDAWKGEK